MMTYVCGRTSDFLVSAWLWHMTFDWFHPFITGAVMYIMLRIVMRKSRLVSAALSASAQLFVVALFFMIVMGGIINGIGCTFEPLSTYTPINSFLASLMVAVIYILFQSLYFGIVSWVRDGFFLRYFFIVLLSNSVAMMVSNLLARMAMAWNYVG